MKPNLLSAQAYSARRFNVVLAICSLWLTVLTVGKAQTTDIILDCNQVTDSPGINVTGAWTLVSASQDYGTGSIHDQGTGNATSTKTVRFTPTLPVAGVYRVYLWWRTNTNRSNDVPVRINHADGQTDVTVNQRQDGEQWNVIGTFRFVQGATNNVVIRTTTTTGIVGADAIRFSLVTPEVIVDNTVAASSPNTSVSTAGAWSSVPVSAVSAYGGSYLSTTTATTETGSATFNAVLPSKGTYDIYVQTHSPASSSTVVPVPLTISRVDLGVPQVDTASISESSQESRHWRYVSRYRFDQGSDGIVRASVKLSNQATVSGLTITADAVRFAKVAENQTIVDNQDSAVFTNGTWNTSSGALTKFGHNFLDNSGITGLREMTFNPTLPLTADYDVYIWWRSNTNNSAGVPVTITHAGGTTVKTAVQNTGGGTWWHAGRYRFNSTTPAAVKLSTQGTTGVVVADAVCFVRDPDSDWDGIDDWWELQYFPNLETLGASSTSDYDEDGISDRNEYLQKSNPEDFYNGVIPDIRILSGNYQFSDLNTFLPEPLTVGIYRSTAPTAELWPGARVTFDIISTNGGSLSLERDGDPLEDPVTVDTSDGIVVLHFKQPNTHGTQSTIQVKAGIRDKDGTGDSTAVTEQFDLYTHLLRAWWKLDEPSGVTVNDSTPKLPVNPGTLIGGATRVAGLGTMGTSYTGDGAVSLSGTGQYISVTEPSNSVPTNDSLKFNVNYFSATAWVQLKTPISLATDTDVYPVLAKWNTGSTGGFELVLKGGSGRGLAFRIYGSGGAIAKEIAASVDQSAKILNGGPHLIAFTRDADNKGRLYLDGVEVGFSSDAAGSLTSSADLWIGKNAASRYLKGIVDDIRLYKSALRVDEIQAMYQAFDHDGDGMSDLWEIATFNTLNRDGTANDDGDRFNDWQEYVNGSSPADFYNGAVLGITVPSGDNQTGAVGTLLAAPIVFQVMEKGSGGAADIALANAPVTITAPPSGRLISASGVVGKQLALKTDANGRVSVGVKLPTTANVAATVTLTASTTTKSANLSTTSEAGEIERWAMDSGVGGTTAFSSQTNNTGTLMGGTSWGTGASGAALTFDGINDTVQISENTSAVLNFGDDQSFSLAFWVKMPQGVPANSRILSKGYSGVSSGYFIGTGSVGQEGSIVFGVGNGSNMGTLLFGTQERFDNDRWHHIVAVFDRASTEARIYVDGQSRRLVQMLSDGVTDYGTLSADQTVMQFPNVVNLSASSVESLYFGSQFAQSKYFRGTIDEVRIFGGRLLADKVVNLRKEFDSDEDGLTNVEEASYGTDSSKWDTDGDGMSDGDEVAAGRDPNTPNIPYTIRKLEIFTPLE